ncbi:hypothetical protein OC861_004735 [Tilletia horrida]|nr:hypothetical protein OC861_004735 [Tilletia horrida]
MPTKKRKRIDTGKDPLGPSPTSSSPKKPKNGPKSANTTSWSRDDRKGNSDVPPHWPSGVRYLRDACEASPLLPPHLSRVFCAPFPIPSGSNPIKSSDLEIRQITSATAFLPHPLLKNKAHPALGQLGLFARKALPARTLVLPYLGIVHLESETDEDSEYDAKVWAKVGEVEGVEGEDVGLGIDATEAGNLARFVNDFRGITSRPNVFFEEWPDPDGGDDEGEERTRSDGISSGETAHQQETSHKRRPRGLALFTGAAGVEAGAELCVSYGKGFWEARGVLPPSASSAATDPGHARTSE